MKLICTVGTSHGRKWDQVKSKTAYISKQPPKILPLYTATIPSGEKGEEKEGWREGWKEKCNSEFSLFTHSHTKVN